MFVSPIFSAGNGTISLEAMGVDLGAEADNPMALSARILAANAIVASAQDGSMDVRVDSSDIDLGLEFTLVNGRSTASRVQRLAPVKMEVQLVKFQCRARWYWFVVCSK